MTWTPAEEALIEGLIGKEFKTRKDRLACLREELDEAESCGSDDSITECRRVVKLAKNALDEIRPLYFKSKKPS